MIPRVLLIANLFALGSGCMMGSVPDDAAVADGANADERDAAAEVSPTRDKDGPSSLICPTTGAVVECGQPCVFVLKGTPIALFGPSCR